MSLINLSIVLFALAALLGIFLLSRILRNKNTPKGVSLLHGAFASTALVLLIIYTINFQRNDLILFIVLFVAAALGGIILIYRDIGGKSIPKPLALFHGVLALSAFVTLVLSQGF